MAHQANALFDAYREDPEFGYRYVVEEAGPPAGDGLTPNRPIRAHCKNTRAGTAGVRPGSRIEGPARFRNHTVAGIEVAGHPVR